MEDRVLEDLLRNRNHQQALKHVTKKLKKSPNDPLSLSYKARILLLSGEYPEALAICKQVSVAGVTNFELIPIFHDVLAELQTRYERSNDPATAEQCCSISEALWKPTIKSSKTATSRNELITLWISQATEAGQWTSLVSATLMMEQNLAKSDLASIRNLWFHQILARWQAATLAVISEKTKAMHKMLASAMIEKAFDAMPDSPTSDTPAGKWIATRSELALLALILESNPSKLLDVLKRKGLDPATTATQDKWGAFALGQQSLRALGRLEEVAVTSRKVLDEAALNPKEDYRWEQLQLWTDVSQLSQDIGRHLLDPAPGSSVAYLLDAVRSEQVPRAARVRLVSLLIASLRRNDDDPTSEQHDRVSSLLEEQLRPDIRSPVPASTIKSIMADVLASKEDPDCLAMTLNVLQHAWGQRQQSNSTWKHIEGQCLSLELTFEQIDLSAFRLLRLGDRNLEMYQELSPAQYEDNEGVTKDLVAKFNGLIETSVVSFVRLRLNTKHLLETDVDPANDALITAVESSYRIATITGQQTFRLLGLLLLHHLVEQKAQDPRIRSLVVNRARALGLNSIAGRMFDPLRIKGISFDKAYPYYFQRVATVCPHNAEPIPKLEKCLKFYDAEIKRIPDDEIHAAEKGNYVQALEMQKWSRYLEESPGRALAFYEKRRMQRIRGHLETATDEAHDFLRDSFIRSSDGKRFSFHGISVDTGGPGWASIKRPERYTKQDVVLPAPFPAPMSSEYLAYLRLVDLCTHELAFSNATSWPSSVSQDFTDLVDITDTMRLLESWLLTPTEKVTLKAQIAVGHFMVTTLASKDPLAFKLDVMVHELENVRSEMELVKTQLDESWKTCIAAKPYSPLPSWVVLQQWMLEFELLQCAVLASRKAAKYLQEHRKKEKASAASKRIEELVRHVQRTAQQTWTSRRAVATDWLNELDQGTNGICERILDAGRLRETTLTVMGEDEARRICSRFVQSAVDSVEGVLRLRLEA